MNKFRLQFVFFFFFYALFESEYLIDNKYYNDVINEYCFKVFVFFNDLTNIIFFKILLFSGVSIFIPLLLAVAYLTLVERKVMGSMQQRLGPNIVGFFGLLQPFADALKLVLKETIIPNKADVFLFIWAPILTFILALISWGVIPFDDFSVYVDLNYGVLYLLACSSFAVYGILIAGWSSNSNYAFLGGLRSAAQMISYEVSMALIILSIIICSESLNLVTIVKSQQNVWFIVPFFPLFIMFFISILAETSRAPFDLPEAEGELVAGFNVEYSAMGFALFFLGEYGNMILMSAITTILFLGGWLPLITFSFFSLIPNTMWFAIKISFLLFGFVWVRSAYPRLRYDQLMDLGWKKFLPFSLALLIFYVSFLFIFFY